VTEFDRRTVEEFRANGGKVGGPFEGTDMLLLHHTGARSGAGRVSPLGYQPVGEGYAIFASKAGAPTHPAWYHNLMAQPNVSIEVGTDTIDVLASEASGEERERLYRTQAERIPQFADYEKTAGERVIPVIVLTPTAAG